MVLEAQGQDKRVENFGFVQHVRNSVRKYIRVGSKKKTRDRVQVGGHRIVGAGHWRVEQGGK